MTKNKLTRFLPDPEATTKLLKKIWGVICNNWGWKLLSVALAICLWGVLISQDTSLPRDKVIDDVRVTVSNAVTLRNNGYIVVSGLEELSTVRIRVSVPQKNYSDATASNYSAKLDLTQIQSAGEQTVKLTASAANPTQYGTVKDVYNADVTVVVEEYNTLTKVPVELRVVGEAPEEYYAGSPSASVTQVDIGGPRSVVERVARCVVEYDLSGLSPERVPNTVSLSFVFEDKAGNALDGSKLTVYPTGQSSAIQRINVSQRVYYKAVVPVDVETLITGEPAEGCQVKSVRVEPQTVTLAGSREAIAPYLEEGAAVYLKESIDISGKAQGAFTEKRELSIPGSLEYSSDKAVTVVVTILREESNSSGTKYGE